jgi:hypothetical protein
MITRKRSVRVRRYTSFVPVEKTAHRLVVGAFPALEPEFVASVRALKERDPLRRVEVLVGSNLLAVYLRRHVADSLGAVANLRFLTFLDLARELLPDDDARPPLPALGEALLARMALERTAKAEAFGSLQRRPSLAEAVASTANDLRGAGIGPEEIPPLLARGSDLEDRRRHLDALAAVLVTFEESRRRFKDATALLERAARAALSPSPEPLLVYGLYDLGGLRERLLGNVARSRPIHAFVPEDGEDEPAGLAPVRTELFLRLLGVEPDRIPSPPLPPPAVTIAPSENAEAREVVREILRAVDAGTPLHRIAILVRNPDMQEPALIAELSLREIPYFRPAGPGFAVSPTGRAVRLLVAFAAHGFQADAFRELLDLLETLGRFPALGLGETSPARLGAALAGLRVTEGLDALEAALRESQGRLELPFPAADDPEGWFARRRTEEKKNLDLLGAALAAIRPTIPSSEPATWTGWAGRLRRSFDDLLGSAPERERLERALEAIEGLERVEPRASVEAATVEAFLGEAIDLSPEIRGRFERDGVSVLSAVSARGLLFDVVLVPGLVEQSFPRSSRPDPLLFDAERRRISEAARKPLVPRTGDRHGREERFLFSLARSSARRRLVLFAAAREIATDRPRLLSPFLIDALPEKAQRSLLLRELGRDGAPLPPNVVWLPAGRLPRGGPPLDADEALRRLLAAGPRIRKTLPAGAPSLARALRRGEARARPGFTEYEGKIGRSVARLALRGAVVSASRLERFSQCAYRSFLERGLGLAALPDAEPDGIFALDPLERGNALHAALRDVTRQLIAEERAFSSLGGGETSSIASREARRAVGTVVAARRAAPPPLLLEIETERLRRLVLGLLRHLAEEGSALPLAGAEIRFGPQTLDPADRDEDSAASTDSPARVPGLPFETRLLGRIDRLDREGDRALVVDYKSGPPAPYGKKNSKGRLVAGGERLQLPAYALAAGLLGATSVASEYLFVEESDGDEAEVTPVRFDEARTAAATGALREVLTLVDEAVGKGLFLPKTKSFRSKDPCGFCDFAAICGPGHARLYERKWAEETRSGVPNPLRRLREVL